MIDVNGVYRNATPYVNVNGVWRKATVYANALGAWRNVDDIKDEVADLNQITSFKVIYKKARFLHYSGHHLHFNDNIRNVIEITGHDSHESNTNPKSLLFRYLNRDLTTQGIYVLEGIVYGVIGDNEIPLSTIESGPSAPDDVEIVIDSSYSCETYGPYAMGWNRLFAHEHCLPREDGYFKRSIISGNQYILPTYKRSTKYDTIALIGIARDLTSHKHTMVGSYGALSHNILSISLNGKALPFTLEIEE